MSHVNIENIPPTSHNVAAENPTKTKSNTSNGSSRAAGNGRKLQTLQPSAKNQKLLVGADGMLQLSTSGKKKEVKIYEDPAPAHSSTPDHKKSENKKVQATVSVASTSTQVENADTAQYRAEQQMYANEDDLPLEYWKDLAEKRREALEESLTENECLHTSLSLLEEEHEKVKEEADTYRSLAEQAQELAKILNSVVSDDDEEEDQETPANQETPVDKETHTDQHKLSEKSEKGDDETKNEERKDEEQSKPHTDQD